MSDPRVEAARDRLMNGPLGTAFSVPIWAEIARTAIAAADAAVPLAETRCRECNGHGWINNEQCRHCDKGGPLAETPAGRAVLAEVGQLWDKGLPPRKRTIAQQRFYDGNNDALRLLVSRALNRRPVIRDGHVEFVALGEEKRDV